MSVSPRYKKWLIAYSAPPLMSGILYAPFHKVMTLVNPRRWSCVHRLSLSSPHTSWCLTFSFCSSRVPRPQGCSMWCESFVVCFPSEFFLVSPDVTSSSPFTPAPSPFLNVRIAFACSWHYPFSCKRSCWLLLHPSVASHAPSRDRAACRIRSRQGLGPRRTCRYQGWPSYSARQTLSEMKCCIRCPPWC